MIFIISMLVLNSYQQTETAVISTELILKLELVIMIAIFEQT